MRQVGGNQHRLVLDVEYRTEAGLVKAPQLGTHLSASWWAARGLGWLPTYRGRCRTGADRGWPPLFTA